MRRLSQEAGPTLIEDVPREGSSDPAAIRGHRDRHLAPKQTEKLGTNTLKGKKREECRTRTQARLGREKLVLMPWPLVLRFLT